ncbi:uncharacterized protein EV422DRAFT_299952 [Fimicolochytrium jonesii]|uniref:uncharacterized protein n=1 Tax=Fimicolochytrium jonesii TaxID=1396493 RepID=UPI0022FF3CA7|nr:uncharacterized protein EV422DRAFT_299952 [Fimicolochytrium jonesii]KAI8816245.1 hypothetical protein EV422DRAFT_299952 [Fimicolochytrium jonesii]
MNPGQSQTTSAQSGYIPVAVSQNPSSTIPLITPQMLVRPPGLPAVVEPRTPTVPLQVLSQLVPVSFHGENIGSLPQGAGHFSTLPVVRPAVVIGPRQPSSIGVAPHNIVPPQRTAGEPTGAAVVPVSQAAPTVQMSAIGTNVTAAPAASVSVPTTLTQPPAHTTQPPPSIPPAPPASASTPLPQQPLPQITNHPTPPPVPLLHTIRPQYPHLTDPQRQLLAMSSPLGSPNPNLAYLRSLPIGGVGAQFGRPGIGGVGLPATTGGVEQGGATAQVSCQPLLVPIGHQAPRPGIGLPGTTVGAVPVVLPTTVQIPGQPQPLLIPIGHQAPRPGIGLPGTTVGAVPVVPPTTVQIPGQPQPLLIPIGHQAPRPNVGQPVIPAGQTVAVPSTTTQIPVQPLFIPIGHQAPRPHTIAPGHPSTPPVTIPAGQSGAVPATTGQVPVQPLLIPIGNQAPRPSVGQSSTPAATIPGGQNVVVLPSTAPVPPSHPVSYPIPPQPTGQNATPPVTVPAGPLPPPPTATQTPTQLFPGHQIPRPTHPFQQAFSVQPAPHPGQQQHQQQRPQYPFNPLNMNINRPQSPMLLSHQQQQQYRPQQQQQQIGTPNMNLPRPMYVMNAAGGQPVGYQMRPQQGGFVGVGSDGVPVGVRPVPPGAILPPGATATPPPVGMGSVPGAAATPSAGGAGNAATPSIPPPGTQVQQPQQQQAQQAGHEQTESPHMHVKRKIEEVQEGSNPADAGMEPVQKRPALEMGETSGDEQKGDSLTEVEGNTEAAEKASEDVMNGKPAGSEKDDGADETADESISHDPAAKANDEASSTLVPPPAPHPVPASPPHPPSPPTHTKDPLAVWERTLDLYLDREAAYAHAMKRQIAHQKHVLDAKAAELDELRRKVAERVAGAASNGVGSLEFVVGRRRRVGGGEMCLYVITTILVVTYPPVC